MSVKRGLKEGGGERVRRRSRREGGGGPRQGARGEGQSCKILQ